jgi:hypothetical protein
LFCFVQGLNRALSAKAGPCTDPNEFGLFVAKFSVECLYSYQKRRISYYFRQVNGKPPSDPICALDVTDTLATTNQLKRGCIRLGRKIDDQNLAATGVEGDPIPDGNINHITPKRRPGINDHDCAAASAITLGNDDCPVPKVGCLVGFDVWEFGCKVCSLVGSNVGSSVPSYWVSSEAAKLFGFSYKNGDDVYTGRQEIVKLLSYTQQSHDGYKQFVAHV